MPVVGPVGGFGAFDDDVVTFPAGGIARYVPPEEQPESAEGTEAPLSRRVPGASSPGSSLDLASRFRTLDPDEARRLVEQFEIGVARALGESATDRVDDEGFGR